MFVIVVESKERHLNGNTEKNPASTISTTQSSEPLPVVLLWPAPPSCAHLRLMSERAFCVCVCVCMYLCDAPLPMLLNLGSFLPAPLCESRVQPLGPHLRLHRCSYPALRYHLCVCVWVYERVYLFDLTKVAPLITFHCLFQSLTCHQPWTSPW